MPKTVSESVIPPATTTMDEQDIDKLAEAVLGIKQSLVDGGTLTEPVTVTLTVNGVRQPAKIIPSLAGRVC